MYRPSHRPSVAGSLHLHGSLHRLAVALGILDGLVAQGGFRLGLAVFVGLHRSGGAVSGLGLGDGTAVGVGGGLDGRAVLLCLSLDLGAVGPGLGLNLGAVGPGGGAGAGGGLAGTAGTAAATAGGRAAAGRRTATGGRLFDQRCDGIINTVTKGTKLPKSRTVIRKLSFAPRSRAALSLSIATQFLRCQGRSL